MTKRSEVLNEIHNLLQDIDLENHVYNSFPTAVKILDVVEEYMIPREKIKINEFVEDNAWEDEDE